MVFMSASSNALGNRCRKIGTTLRTPSYFRSGVPSSRMVTPASSAASATASPCGTWGVSTEIWNVNCSRNRRRTRFDSLGTSFIMVSLLFDGWAGTVVMLPRMWPFSERREAHECEIARVRDKVTQNLCAQSSRSTRPRKANRSRRMAKIRGQLRPVGPDVSRRRPTRLWSLVGGGERIADGMDHRELRSQDG